MDTLRLMGVRSLLDTGPVELRPVTLLVGKNSSGKSTFLRSLPLIKQSVRTRSAAPILWFGEYVDFGSFNEVKSASDEVEQIEISIGFKNANLRTTGLYDPRSVTRKFSDVIVAIKLGQDDDRTRLTSVTFQFNSDIITCALDNRGIINSLVINDEDWTPLTKRIGFRVTSGEVVPQVSYVRGKGEKEVPSFRKGADAIEDELARYLRTFLGFRISHQNILRMIRRVRYTPLEEFAQSLQKSRSDLVTWNRFVDSISYKGSPSLKRIHAYYLLMTLPDLSYQLSRLVLLDASGVAYIGPSRATGERYYRFQELAVEQIDPQGRNLAMFLNSLPRVALGRFSDWMRDELGYNLRLDRSAGHVQIQLQEVQSSEYFNLADMGYGFSQILPVLAQLWTTQTRVRSGSRVIAIEQPELHLHPAYQARLADLFSGIVKDNNPLSEIDDGRIFREKSIKLVVETHSETMINRFGELIADGRLEPQDVAIYRFEKDEETGVSKVSRSNFAEDGTLDCWPIGFFGSGQIS